MSHPDPEVLALAALPAEPTTPHVTEHLEGCAHCRAEVADLRRTVELAREAGVDALVTPPPRVWRAIAAELGLPTAGDAHDGAPSAPPDTGAAPPAPVRAGSRRRRVLVPVVAAVVLGIGAGLGLGRVWAPAPAPPPAVTAPPATVPLGPVGGLDPGASGTVGMVDDRGVREMVVQVSGVTNLAGGDHLEAWLMDASGKRLVPLGPLDGRNGDFRGRFAVPAGLPLGEFDRVDVSAERWDGDPGHSTLSVLRGTL